MHSVRKRGSSAPVEKLVTSINITTCTDLGTDPCRLCRRFVYPCGSVIGTTEFFSHRVRIFHTVAGDEGCRLLTMSREAFNGLQNDHPQVSCKLIAVR